MPIDFGQFVFQPSPLQKWHVGEGFAQAIQGNRERARLAQEESQFARRRSDTQATTSADLAIKQNEIGYEDEQKKYIKRAQLSNDARAAWAAGQYGKVRALGGQLAALGGIFKERPVPGKLPEFDIDAGKQPGRPGLDIPGARRSLYGPSSVEASAPFQVPGFGPDGKRNPMDPHALPGLSAAAMPPPPPPAGPGQGQPQQPAPPPPYPGREGMAPPPGVTPDAAGPPPGPAVDQPPGAPQAEQPGSPQLTGPNPYNTPTFSPYRLDTNAQVAENQARLQPWMEGTRGGVPAEYQYRMDKINQAAGQLGLPPEEALKLYQPAFGTIAGLMRADINRESAKASMGLRGQAMENSRNLQMQRMAASRVDKIGEKYGLSANLKRYTEIDNVKALLEARTGQADTQAISALRNMFQSGVMTDKDFENVKSGAVRTWWQAIKDGTYEKLIANGVSPDARAALFQLVEIAKQSAARSIGAAQNALLSTVRNPRTSSTEERDYYINELSHLPEELWDPIVRDAMSIPMDQKSGAVDSAGNYAVKPAARAPDAGGESLGVVPLPGAGGGKKKTTGAKGANQGTLTISGVTISADRKSVTVGGKTKAVESLTDEEMGKLPLEVLRELMPKPEEEQ